METEEVTPQEAPAEEPVVPTEPEPEPTPEPVYLTAEQVSSMLEQQQNKIQTWLGRRDAELVEKLKSRPAPDPDKSRESMLDDPDQFFANQLQQYERKQTQYMSDVTMAAANLMDNDPLFADQELGSKVVQEITKLATGINKQLPANLAAKQLVSDATLAVMRKQRTAKKNPLEGNKPTQGLGNVTPPAGQKKKPVAAPKLSAEAQKIADKWGYKPEDIAKLFPNG